LNREGAEIAKEGKRNKAIATDEQGLTGMKKDFLGCLRDLRVFAVKRTFE
jgi:hypothetical protein